VHGITTRSCLSPAPGAAIAAATRRAAALAGASRKVASTAAAITSQATAGPAQQASTVPALSGCARPRGMHMSRTPAARAAVTVLTPPCAMTAAMCGSTRWCDPKSHTVTLGGASTAPPGVAPPSVGSMRTAAAAASICGSASA
jgi:hypothetical protein